VRGQGSPALTKRQIGVWACWKEDRDENNQTLSSFGDSENEIFSTAACAYQFLQSFSDR
jgi:hypothetical protein